jgi:hypothetical protein
VPVPMPMPMPVPVPAAVPVAAPGATRCTVTGMMIAHYKISRFRVYSTMMLRGSAPPPPVLECFKWVVSAQRCVKENS